MFLTIESILNDKNLSGKILGKNLNFSLKTRTFQNQQEPFKINKRADTMQNRALLERNKKTRITIARHHFATPPFQRNPPFLWSNPFLYFCQPPEIFCQMCSVGSTTIITNNVMFIVLTGGREVKPRKIWYSIWYACWPIFQ